MSSSASIAPPSSNKKEPPVLDAAKADRKLRGGLISLAVLVAIVVGLVLAVPGLHGVGKTVAHMNPDWIVIAVALELLSCLGYVFAFLQVFDEAPVRFGRRVALSELAFGAAVSLGGAGSVSIGALLLIERGAKPTRVAERSAVLFLLTSAINAGTLVLAGLLLFFGILPGPSNPLLGIIPAGVGIAAFIIFLSLPRFVDRYLDKAPKRLRTLLSLTAESIRDTKAFLLHPDWRLLGAIAYLWCDIAVMVACFAATGYNPPLVAIILAYQIGYLANAIPVPGSIGILDGSLIGMFVIYGIKATPAAAATVVYHAIALFIPAAWGTLAFITLRRTRHKPLKLRPSFAERRRIKAREKEVA